MKEATGSKAELKVYEDRFRKDGHRERVAVERDHEDTTTRDGQYALVVAYIYSQNHELEKTTLYINSCHILAAFQETIGRHPTVASDFSKPCEMESPFQMLIHFWDELLAYREATTDDKQRLHLGLLLEFMDLDLGHDRRLLLETAESGWIHFKTAWAIFRPGDLVVTYIKEQPWLLRVQSSAYEESTRIGPYLEVNCTFTDCDGTRVGYAKERFVIAQKQSFAQGNPSRVNELPVFPRRFVPEKDSFEERLLKRGETFLAFRGSSIKHCKGSAQYLSEPPLTYWDDEMEDTEIWMSYFENGQVIVDRGAYLKDNYQPTITPMRDITDVDRMLCPPFVHGFSVGRMDWARFWLSTLQEVEWNVRSFDQLILPERQRHLIKALVHSHDFPESDSEQSQQKGKGLVVLLYGPPGCGKTLTAECAANVTKKALFTTSFHQLNRDNYPRSFEYHLRRILRLATFWNAVVLFDEADVLLEHRSDEAAAATRNALVAIFLHHLEYFSGIVFLTTNRIRVFDQAMKSRVHLALEYAPLGPESRREVWSQCLRKIPAEEVDLNMDEVLPLLMRERRNGREISNTVNTARTLARFEEKPLTMSHLKTVLEVWQDFERSLGSEKLKSLSISRSSEHDGVSHGHFIRRGSILSEEPESI